jgi:hypothetical protein
LAPVATAAGGTSKGRIMAMAKDEDDLLRSRREGWQGFTRLLGWSLFATVLILGAMALFLL